MKLITQQDMERFFQEDGFEQNFRYWSNLPTDPVKSFLYIKQDLLLAGVDAFIAVFTYLDEERRDWSFLKEFEGKSFQANEKIVFPFPLPFNVALSAERLALNFLQHASSIATQTKKVVDSAKKYNIAILDTRKTTPGLRNLEKYAVTVGGGKNHRFSQVDSFMIKDNHKTFFGGLKPALEFFKSQSSFYTNLVVEIHLLSEIEEASKLGVRHFLLDNFSPEQLEQAIRIKPSTASYEVSGGITEDNIDQYLIKGIDAISMGFITYDAPHVDISFKYSKG